MKLNNSFWSFRQFWVGYLPLVLPWIWPLYQETWTGFRKSWQRLVKIERKLGFQTAARKTLPGLLGGVSWRAGGEGLKGRASGGVMVEGSEPIRTRFRPVIASRKFWRFLVTALHFFQFLRKEDFEDSFGEYAAKASVVISQQCLSESWSSNPACEGIWRRELREELEAAAGTR